MKELTPEQALVRLENACARAEYSTGEIRQKLYRWGIAQPDIDKIVQSLVERRFVDDRRFAAAFVREKSQFAAWGKRKIIMALYQKGIPNDIANEAIEDLDYELYADNLLNILRRKAGDLGDITSFEARTKLFRFAASKGFEPHLIIKAIDRLTRPD